jgi:L-iditol 2-dehydrogenase
VRAALLHGPEDLRVESVPAPVPTEGEFVVRVSAATTCGTDVKMWRRGHPALDAYPARFGHETAGVRGDTGEPVLVSPSVACGACASCLAGRPQICRRPEWVLGGFAEAIASPPSALHAIPDGLEPAGAAMAEPLAAALHAVSRGNDAAEAGVLGGGPMGLMLARLLVLDGRRVTVADPHAERRAQAEALGATATETLGRLPLVFEAVGRPEAWRAAVQAAQPGGTVVFVGGCPAGTDAELPTHPVHYDELDLCGAFHHSRDEVERALTLLAGGDVAWEAWAGPRIRLEDLAGALARARDGPARKWIVEPDRPA